MTLTDALHPVMASINSNQVITTSVLVLPHAENEMKGFFFALAGGETISFNFDDLRIFISLTLCSSARKL